MGKETDSSDEETSKRSSKHRARSRKKQKKRKHKRARYSSSSSSSRSSSSSSSSRERKKSKKSKLDKRSSEKQRTLPSGHIDASVKVFDPVKRMYKASQIIVLFKPDDDLDSYRNYLEENYLKSLAHQSGLFGKFEIILHVLIGEKTYEVTGPENWKAYKAIIADGGAHFEIKIKPTRVVLKAAEIKDQRGSYTKNPKVKEDEKLSSIIGEIIQSGEDIKGKMREIPRTDGQKKLLADFQAGIIICFL